MISLIRPVPGVKNFVIENRNGLLQVGVEIFSLNFTKFLLRCDFTINFNYNLLSVLEKINMLSQQN